MAAKVISTVSPWFVNLLLEPPEVRAALAAAFPSGVSDVLQVEGGVLPSAGDAGLSYTSTGTTGAPKVTITAGRCVIPVASHYGYACTLPAATQVALSNPPTTNPRKDLVVGKIYGGSELGDADTGFYIETIDGTPSASPPALTAPARSIPICDAQVSTGGIVTFTDRRTYTRAAGGIRRSVRDTTRAGSHPLDLRISETGLLESYIGTAWVSLASPAVWNSFTPVLRYSGASSGGSGSAGVVNLGTTGTAVGRYIVLGKTCHLRYAFRASGTGINGGSGSIYTDLPAGITSAPQEETQIICKLNVLDLPNEVYWGPCFIPSGNTILYPFLPRSATDNKLAPYSVATGAGGAGTGIPYIAGGYPNPGITIIQGSIEIG